MLHNADTINRVMELIKPFLKYSKLYRQTTSPSVRHAIYYKWYNEIKPFCGVRSATDTMIATRCIFCHENLERHDKQRRFCKHCLFPLYGFDEELITYCLLSVCYYEGSSSLSYSSEESHRTVYRQRLKMTWYEFERMGKLYEVHYPHCLQCHRKTASVGAKFTYFNDLMFCSHCMFPLFNIIMYRINI